MSDLTDRITDALEGITPGPWSVGLRETEVWGGEGLWLVAEEIDNEADARLIAAAPALLSECKALLEQLPASVLAVAQALTCEVPEGWRLEGDWGVRELDVFDTRDIVASVKPERDGQWWLYDHVAPLTTIPAAFPSAQAAVDAITGRDAE